MSLAIRKLLLLTCSVWLISTSCIAQNWLYLDTPVKWVNLGDLDVSGTQFTVEAKIMKTASSSNIVSKHTNPTDVNYLLRPGGFEITTSNGYFSCPANYTINNNECYHVAATYDGANVRYYVNGCETNSVAVTGTMFLNNLNTAIGDQSSCQCEPFTGYIDEVRIWNVARTQQQISGNMNNLPSPTVQAGLLAYYQFEGNYVNVQGNTTWNGTPVGATSTTTNPTCNQIDTLTVSAAGSDPTCFAGSDGSISITASGAATPYTYSIDGSTYQSSNVFNGLAAGSYTVYAKSGTNCIETTSITLTDPAPIATSAGLDTSICPSGSAPLNATGGVSYLWSPAGTLNNPNIANPIATPSVTTTYSVTVTDASGCSATNSVTVTVVSVSVSVTTTDALCNGGNDGTATANASGGLGNYTFQWDGNAGNQSTQTATGLSSNTYSVTATDSIGCSVTNSGTVNEPGQLVVNTNSTNESNFGACDGTVSATVTGGTTPYAYNWSNSATTQTITGLCSGLYTLTVTDANGCATTEIDTISGPGCFAVLDFNTWGQQGNPANGNWTVQGGGGSVFQSINGEPTFYVSPFDLINVEISGNFMTTDSDDDFMGFVFGYQNPLGTPYDNYDCWLFDWKQGNQGAAQEGMSLVQIQGTIPSGSNGTYFWDHTSDATFNVVANNWGAGTGWTTGYNHQFTLIYTLTQITAYVDGTLVFQQTGCFEPGRFGFYNYSQKSVTYSNFSYQMSIDFSIPAPDVCVNEPALMQFLDTCVQNFNFAMIDTMLWDYGDGSMDTILSPTITTVNPTHVYTAPGIYTVKLTVVDPSGCTDTALQIINVHAVSATISSYTDILCNGGNNGAVDLSTTGLGTPFTYNWSNGLTTEDLTGLTAGNYSVTVTDTYSCTDTISAMLTEPPILSAIVSTTNVLCKGACDGSATISPTGGVLPYSYQWDAAANSQTTDSAIALCAGTFDITVTDANACSLIDSAIITEPDSLTISFSITDVSCYSACDGSVDATASGGTTLYSYLWSTGNTSQSANSLCAGAYGITITDFNQCAADSMITITEPPEIVLSTDSTNATCNGYSDGTTTVLASGGILPYSYSWNNGQTDSTATGLPVGTYSVTVTDATAAGCNETMSVSITQPPVLVLVAFANDDTICVGQSVDLTANAAGGTAPYIFVWNNIDTNQYITDFPSNDTDYTVNLFDANNCPVTPVTIPVYLHPPLSIAVTNDTICDGETATISVVVSGGDGAPYTYSWDNGGTASSIQVLPTIYPNPSFYIVTAWDGCSPTLSDTAIVMFYPTPVIIFTASNTYECVPMPINFAGVSIPSGICEWDFGDGGTDNSCNPDYVYETPGNYDVTLTVTTPEGCVNDTTYYSYITANEKPVAYFGMSPQPTTVLWTEIEFSDNSIGPVTQWNWNFDFTTAVDSNPVIIYPPIAGEYPVELIVITYAGCRDTVEKTVIINPEFEWYIPNSFTPNEDGINDYFLPQGIGINDETYHLMIFNRWGDRIWETFKPGIGWDGMHNGTPLAEDVYIWKLIIADLAGNEPENRQTIGSVTLIR